MAAALLLGSCAGVPLPLAEVLPRAQGAWPGVTLEELAEARDLYLRKCGSCHRALPPSRRSAEQWTSTLKKMAPRSRITAEEEARLKRFLAAMAP